jgi:hypothetical protein
MAVDFMPLENGRADSTIFDLVLEGRQIQQINERLASLAFPTFFPILQDAQELAYKCFEGVHSLVTNGWGSMDEAYDRIMQVAKNFSISDITEVISNEMSTIEIQQIFTQLFKTGAEFGFNNITFYFLWKKIEEDISYILDTFLNINEDDRIVSRCLKCLVGFVLSSFAYDLTKLFHNSLIQDEDKYIVNFFKIKMFLEVLGETRPGRYLFNCVNHRFQQLRQFFNNI